VADERFLKCSKFFFNDIKSIKKKKWINDTLLTSYRFGKNIALFINTCVLSIDRIETVKKGGNVEYIICNTFKPKKIYKLIKNTIKKYKEDEIFVLAPSIEKCRQVKDFSNFLSNISKKIFAPNSDDLPLNERTMKNKITISTFHKVKGLERKLVIVFCFDESYYYYNKSTSRTICPNEIYVAITRPTETLILLHHKKNNYLPFINSNLLKDYSNVVVFCIPNQNNYKDKNDFKVTELVKHIPPSLSIKCIELINCVSINNKVENIEINDIIDMDTYEEDVLDIIGIAIPAYFEHEKTGDITIFKQLPEYDKENINNINILYLSNIYNSKKSGYRHRLKQIKRYDWLPQSTLNNCIIRMNKYVIGNIICEKSVPIKFNDKININGDIDCIDEKTIWEFKCTKSITPSHILQLALYSYMWNNSKYNKKITNLKS
jgi:hypothetical protein